LELKFCPGIPKSKTYSKSSNICGNIILANHCLEMKMDSPLFTED